MNFSLVRGGPVLGSLLVGVVACTSTPAQPTTSQVSGTPGAASVTAPTPVSPANNAQINFTDQPILVVVANATITKGSGTTYLFEIATDAGFTAKVQTKDGVPEGTGGQTGVRLDSLVSTNATSYYWHARATAAGTIGVFGPTYKFVVGPAINITAPIPIGPTLGASVSVRPTLTVINAARTGPAGPITYRFEIADNVAFNPVTASGNVAEGQGQTGFTPISDLTINKTYYWRATAIDQTNAVSSPATALQSFSTNNPLWPGVQPPAGSGHAVLGNNWQTQVVVSFTGFPFTSPTLEQLQLFDLLDRGFDPQGAIDWMHRNGYSTSASYFPGLNVIGFPFSYMALINGRWDLIIRNGA